MLLLLHILHAKTKLLDVIGLCVDWLSFYSALNTSKALSSASNALSGGPTGSWKQEIQSTKLAFFIPKHTL